MGEGEKEEVRKERVVFPSQTTNYLFRYYFILKL
jgi:hypothetical protein